MKDPRLFIIVDGYQVMEWSNFDEDRKHLFELTANNNHLTMVYDDRDDIMTFRGKWEYLHWFVKDLCHCYDLVIS
jgi:hypothetical protein